MLHNFSAHFVTHHIYTVSSKTRK